MIALAPPWLVFKALRMTSQTGPRNLAPLMPVSGDTSPNPFSDSSLHKPSSENYARYAHHQAAGDQAYYGRIPRWPMTVKPWKIQVMKSLVEPSIDPGSIRIARLDQCRAGIHIE